MLKSGRRGSRPVSFSQDIFTLLFVAIFFGVLTTAVIFFWPYYDTEEKIHHYSLRNADQSEEIIVKTSAPHAAPRDATCTFHTCLDVYHCGYNDEPTLRVYIYPFNRYIDENGVSVSLPISQEYEEILQAVADSHFYTSDPETACIFLPSIDLLNQNKLRLEELGQVLASLPWWNNGSNHVLFNMLPGSIPDYHTVLDIASSKAVIAGAGFSSWTYRRTFDVSIPVFNPLVMDVHIKGKSYLERRSWLLISAQTGLRASYRATMQSLAREDRRFLILERCPHDDEQWNFTRRCSKGMVYDYPSILQDATFCVIVRGARLGQTALSDALMTNCIPVIVADNYVMPFSEVIDWKRASIQLREADLSQVIQIIAKVTMDHIYELRQQARFLWKKYFHSMSAITLTTLDIINDRLFPYAAKTYEEWNEIPNKDTVSSPLFLPLIAPKAQGFTAVILTYDRLDSLFHVIRQVAKATSLAKVLVVWNNQKKAPPQTSAWPKINKPLKVVQTPQNRLSNRFYPYDEIETECILALDDDIVMLTADELEFGFQVWREFSDRLVGFPSRLHIWDNTTMKWKYESEWTNTISMVLTGGAFYHKYYGYLYTSSMPGNIRTWVDEHINCEDIAMNFLISNITGKAPIKVTPRKKFKCPECVNIEMLSSDITHMLERSECINHFMDIYGGMPLKTVEFRADPVLYKNNFPSSLKLFNDIGSL